MCKYRNQNDRPVSLFNLSRFAMDGLYAVMSEKLWTEDFVIAVLLM